MPRDSTTQRKRPSDGQSAGRPAGPRPRDAARGPVTLPYAAVFTQTMPPIGVLREHWYWIVLAILLPVTALAFLPAFTADFVRWDDPDYVMFNKLIQTWGGLKELWNPNSDKIQQYYPLVFSSYLLEYMLGAHDAAGKPTATVYHVTNVILHLLNTGLVLLLARKLGASRGVAAFVAAVFALHPAQVASVVWIAERKNTLSGLFYVLSILAWLRFRRTTSWFSYAACLLAFLAGMLSKTQILTLPITLLLLELWKRPTPADSRAAPAPGGFRPRALIGIFALLVPMLIVGGLAAKTTTRVEKMNGPSRDPSSISTPQQRPFVVATAAWHYVSTFLAPVDLAIVYPRWKVPGAGGLGSNPKWLLAPLGWMVVAGLVLWQWGRIDGMVKWGVAQFFLIVSPALGVIPYNYQQYSFVADHFLYLATIGGALAVGRAVERGVDAATRSDEAGAGKLRGIVAAVAVLLFVAAAAKTNIESTYWRENEVFWRRAIVKNGDCFPAFYNLGNHYARQQPPEWKEAAECYKESHRVQPENGKAFENYARAIAVTRGPAEAINLCDQKLGDPKTSPKVRMVAQAIKEMMQGKRPLAPGWR